MTTTPPPEGATEQCLWVRDASEKKRRRPLAYQDLNPEAYRCTPLKDPVCRPCLDRFRAMGAF